MARRNNSGQTLKNLREMGNHVLKAAKQELRNGANMVVSDAKKRVPVKSGKLRDSIKAKGNSKGSSYKISADAQNKGYQYGKIVEFRPGHQRPFLYPALEANKQRIRENIKDKVKQAIRRGH